MKLVRPLAVVAVVLGSIVGPASAASAHGIAGVTATNYQTRLLSVRPGVDGVTVRLIETGDRIEVANRTDRPLVVLGYQEEPYLRIGPDGVFENRRSPSTYVNVSRDGRAPVPAVADASAAPDWRKVSDGHVARWHDHRSHWMGGTDPPAVARHRNRTHVVIPRWTVTMQLGRQTIRASGDLRWVPGPSPLPWLALAAVAFAATIVGSVRGSRLIPVVAALVAIDSAHALGVEWIRPGGATSKLGHFAVGNPVVLLVWVLGGATTVLLLKRRTEGIALAGALGAVVALNGGGAHLADFHRSLVPFAPSAPVARALVAASLGAGSGLIVAAVIGATSRRVSGLE